MYDNRPHPKICDICLNKWMMQTWKPWMENRYKVSHYVFKFDDKYICRQCWETKLAWGEWSQYIMYSENI